MALVNPVPKGRLTDRYGPRGYVPGIGDLGFHTGQDYAADEGTPILAAHNGTVTRRWWDTFANGAGAGGNMVEVLGDDGIVTRYAHMKAQSPFWPGARVAAGRSIVGHVGSSGAATGPHLHFEALTRGSFTDPVPLISKPGPVSAPTQSPEEDDDMAQNTGIYCVDGKGVQRNAIINTGSGFFGEYQAAGKYNNAVAEAFVTGSYVKVTESHFDAVKRQCAEVRAGK